MNFRAMLPHAFRVEPTNNHGAILCIGCRTFAFGEKGKLKKAICEYIDDPETFLDNCAKEYELEQELPF